MQVSYITLFVLLFYNRFILASMRVRSILSSVNIYCYLSFLFFLDGFVLFLCFVCFIFFGNWEHCCVHLPDHIYLIKFYFVFFTIGFHYFSKNSSFIQINSKNFDSFFFSIIVEIKYLEFKTICNYIDNNINNIISSNTNRSSKTINVSLL